MKLTTAAGRLARRDQLVTAAWLRALVCGAPVEAAPAPGWRLIEVGSGSPGPARIRGAGYLDTGAFERGPRWSKVPDRELLQVLLAHGIRHDVPVVLYGRSMPAAARLAHLLLYAGVSDVRLLDGGLPAWQAGGFPLEAGPPAAAAPVAAFGAPFPGRPEYLAGAREAREIVRGGHGLLVSIRTWDEFSGRTSGYPYIEARGDIPGARWGRAGRNGDVHCMGEFQRADGTMRPAHEIEAFWARSGIHREARAVFYCGTAWRASLAFFYAWLMGWERISVYDGGWCDWSSDARNAAARHPAPAALSA